MANLVSKQLVDFVKGFEGFYPQPYYDCVGVKTLGYGMTGNEIAGISYVTEEQASKMLEDLLNNKYAQPIKDNLDNRGVKLSQNEFDALVSMAYNVGTDGLLGSTLYRNICAGVRDVNTITEDFCMWDKAGGKEISGLLRRRKAEAAMFFSNNNDKVEEDIKVENIVIYHRGADEHSAEILADYLNCPTISNDRKFDFSCVKNVYAVGGTKEQYTSYLTKLISGADRYATDQAVLDFIKNGGK